MSDRNVNLIRVAFQQFVPHQSLKNTTKLRWILLRQPYRLRDQRDKRLASFVCKWRHRRHVAWHKQKVFNYHSNLLRLVADDQLYKTANLKMALFSFILLSLVVNSTISSRIVGFNAVGGSEYLNMRLVLEELAARGHEVQNNFFTVMFKQLSADIF